VPSVSKRILVVEDDADIASIIAAAAQDEGWEVVIAVSGGEALRQWRERGADLRPAAIVLSAATEAPGIARALDLPLVGKPFELEG
jgi:DNA-binding response OmpR family regulator